MLHILDGLRSGGAETFIMNIYRNINRDRIQLDFLLRSKKDNVYVDEVKSLGGKIYFISPFPPKICSNLSDSITNEVMITKNIVKLPLSFNNKEWADEILKMLNNFERVDIPDNPSWDTLIS